jgi:hypothetical protein
MTSVWDWAFRHRNLPLMNRKRQPFERFGTLNSAAVWRHGVLKFCITAKKALTWVLSTDSGYN